MATAESDPAGRDIVVNATPLGMARGDPMPIDVARIAPEAFVGDVVMTAGTTPFVAAALARGCRVQPGIDMLFEQIPLYLEFFGFPTTTAAHLREIASASCEAGLTASAKGYGESRRSGAKAEDPRPHRGGRSRRVT